ncbi:MAG: multicomponent Na+:H+ antiporter subunit [Solirubrobacteraceae bacterium]|nr:multicomponent Na+:H+ antiporter subunit [Solirubrobacteraceae bacterium]
MNVWLWSAAVLTAAMVPLVAVAVRRPPLEGLIALEIAGADVVLVLLLIAEGTQRQGFVDLAVVAAVTSFVGAVAFVRFLEKVR